MPYTHKRYEVSQGVWGSWLPHKENHKSGALRGVPAQGVDAYWPAANSGVGGAAPSKGCVIQVGA